MTNNQILQADMLDILFEHRNKLYGAYALRKTYSNRLGKSLGIALVIALAFISFSFFKSKRNSNGGRIESGTYVVTDVNLEKKEIEEVRPKQKPPQKATADFDQFKIVPDKEADKDIPDMDKISTSLISNKNSDGDIDDGTTLQIVENNTGNGTGTEKPDEEVVQPDLPTRQPQFPGGDAEWIRFLQRYLQAPEDLEPGQRIEVLVRFWVGIDGSVSRAEVIKSGGSSFDKEVLRVLRKMPKWEPALQHGNPVAVAYTQPVTFMGVEQ